MDVDSPSLRRPVTFFALVLTRVFFSRFTLAYIPMSPARDFFAGTYAAGAFSATVSVDGGRGASESGFFAELLAKLATALKEALPKNTLFLRMDPDVTTDTLPLGCNSGKNGRREKRNPILWKRASVPPKLCKAPADIQPPDTVVLRLDQPEEAVFAGMKPKWRYNIRLAEKKGVETLCFLGADVLRPGAFSGAEGDAAVSALDVFYSLYEETAKRDGIAIHGKAYYRSLFELCAGADSAVKPPRYPAAGSDAGSRNLHASNAADVRMYVAKHGDDILAAIITVFCAGKAVYLYGASSGMKRALMPAYALQWKAIRDAKSASCGSYDFYGIPPTDDERHPMHGLYRFKTGFGGEIVHRVGSLDAPYKTVLYRVYRIAETARLLWFKRIAKTVRRLELKRKHR